MATATKKRTTDADQETMRLEELDQLQQEQEDRLQAARRFLADSVPVLAAGDSADKAALREALDITGVTVEQLEQYTTDYRRLQELQVELEKHDRTAMIADLRTWQQEFDEHRKAHLQRLTERRVLLGELSAAGMEVGKLRAGLRAAGILPTPEVPAGGYRVVSGGPEFIDPREPLSEKDLRARRNGR